MRRERRGPAAGHDAAQIRSISGLQGLELGDGNARANIECGFLLSQTNPNPVNDNENEPGGRCGPNALISFIAVDRRCRPII